MRARTCYGVRMKIAGGRLTENAGRSDLSGEMRWRRTMEDEYV